MSKILDGQRPDFQFYFPASERKILEIRDDYKLYRGTSELYTDKELTKKAGVIVNKLEYDRISSSFTGYVLIGDKGSISYAANGYSVAEQKSNLYVNQIIYGTNDFLEAKGFAVAIYDINPILNTISPGTILIYLEK